MPLDRAHMSTLERRLVRAFPVVFAALGLNLLFTSDAVLRKTPAFDFAADYLPLQAWGVMLVAAAAGMTWAMVTHVRKHYMAAMVPAAGVMVVWTAFVVLSTVQGDSSPTACIWTGFVVYVMWAVYGSLLVRG